MTILPDADWRRQPGLSALLDRLDAAGQMVRFVGGAVRDTLLGLPVKDVDCATRHLPEDSRRRIEAAGFKAVATGIRHGTVTAVLPQGPVEITTLRRDVATDGRHAVVAFTDAWQEDAARRDFTINAMSADPLSGEVFDYFGGIDDLAARKIRFIGDARTRIAEDHLRILRMFRFHARFGAGPPDQEALTACIERANDLMALSRERIADELLKLLRCDSPAASVALMFDSGIFRPIIPEIDEAGVARLARLIERERVAGVAGDGVRRLGALLPVDPLVAGAVARRLKLSRAAIRRLELAASDQRDAPRALSYRLGHDVAQDLILRGDIADDAIAAQLALLDGWERPNMPLGGGKLIALGLNAGPQVAATLQAIERRWVAEDFPGKTRLDEIAAEEIDQALRAIR